MQSTCDLLLKIGMTLAILKISGKITLSNSLFTNSAKGEAVMSFNCFIIFVGKLLGPVFLLACRSEIRSSSMAAGVIRKARLFLFSKKLEKFFLVVEIFFCNFLGILVKKLLKCSVIWFWSVIFLVFWIRDKGEFVSFFILTLFHSSYSLQSVCGDVPVYLFPKDLLFYFNIF